MMIFASVLTVCADTVTITKKWNDGLKGEAANNRQAPKVMIRGEFLAEEFIDFYYPVGSYYETSTDVDPNEVFVGTWVKETKGMVHLSGGSSYAVSKANDNGGVGAQDGGTSKAILPAHTHSVPARGGSTGTVSNDHTHYMKVLTDSKTAGSVDVSSYSGTGFRYTCPSDSHIHSVTINGANLSTVGVSSAGQNMQPYINVNRWHRIS